MAQWRGPALMLLTMGLFAVLDANNKLLAGQYPVEQAVVLRYITLLLLLAATRLLVPGAGGRLGTRHPWLNLARGTAMVGSAVGFYLALRDIPLVEGYVVYFTGPFLTLGLAALLLGERAPRAVWLWSALGFGGVLLAMWPGLSGGGRWDAYLWAMLATVCYALVLTINRRLRGETGLAQLILWTSLPGLLLLLPFALLDWVMPDARDLAALALNGLLAGCATVALAVAFRHDSAARLAPLEFSALLWALLFDVTIWGLVPGLWTAAGAVVVVCAVVMASRAAGAARAA